MELLFSTISCWFALLNWRRLRVAMCRRIWCMDAAAAVTRRACTVYILCPRPSLCTPGNVARQLHYIQLCLYILFSSIKVKTLGRCAVGYDVCTQQPPWLGVHAPSTFCAQDAVYVLHLRYIQPRAYIRCSSIKDKRLWTATLLKIQMQPQVTFS